MTIVTAGGQMPTGWCPGSRSIAEMGTLYPKSSAARVFFAPGEGLPASAWTDSTLPGRQRLVDLPANCTAVVSFKDQGVDRLAFVEAWQKYRPDVRLDLITHHEPEQQTGGDPTPAQYRASWTRTREQVGAHPARAAGRLRLATCWTLQWIRKGGDWRLWFPDHEASAVDLVLFDWYPYMAGEPNPYKPRVYEDPLAALKVPIDIAAQLSKPWGIAEINHEDITTAGGFTVNLDPDGSKGAAWYRAMHGRAKASGCKVWAHYHQGGGDLAGRPAMQQALRDLIAQEATVTQTIPQPTPTLTREDVTGAVLDALRQAVSLGASGPAKRLAEKGWATTLPVLSILTILYEHAVDGRALDALTAMRTQLAEGFAEDDNDVQEILAAMLATLSPAAIAAAIAPEVAQDVIDELHARTAPRAATGQ